MGPHSHVHEGGPVAPHERGPVAPQLPRGNLRSNATAETTLHPHMRYPHIPTGCHFAQLTSHTPRDPSSLR